MKVSSTYDTAKNPTNKMWYVVGYCGRSNGKRTYIAISEPYPTKPEAETRKRHLIEAERHSYECLNTI